MKRPNITTADADALERNAPSIEVVDIMFGSNGGPRDRVYFRNQKSKTIQIIGMTEEAPRAVVERKYKKEIREELEKQLLSDATREAIQQEKLRVMSVAGIEDVELGDDKSMKFTATLVTHPDFELPNYKGLMVPMKSIDVTDAEIEESLENLRDQAADFVDVQREIRRAFEVIGKSAGKA